MGVLTRTEIVNQGLALTSRADLSTLAVVELLAWLRQHAADLDWPKLMRRIEDVSLSAGSRSLSIGAGSNGVTPLIQKIVDPIWIYKSDFTQQGTVRVESITDTLPAFDESINSPTLQRARPNKCKVRPNATTDGKWDIWFMSVPDQAYKLAIDYVVQLADPGASEKPWYQNDRTMIQVVKCFALDYAKRYDVLAQEREILARMQLEDRARYGQIAGTNDFLPLDSGIFR